MSPTRVLYVDLAPTPAGSVVSLRYLLRELDRSRYQPVVLLSSQNRAVSWFRDMDLPVYTIPSRQGQGVAFGPRVDAWRQGGLGEWMRSHPRAARIWHTGGALLRWRRKLWPEAQRIYQVIARVQPDLVHFNAELVVNRAGLLAAYMAHVPAICHVRGWEAWDVWDRLLARTVKAFICNSRAVAEPLRRMGVPDHKLHVIYNGVILEDIPTEPDPALYRELGLSRGDPIVGMVGRLVDWKGHPVFLRALARVAQEFPRVQGLVVGAVEITDPHYLDTLQDLARSLGIGSRVHFVGHRDDVLRLYALMDVLVHASVRDEPFGRVLIEGMAAARPVVATRGGGTPEIVRHGETGFLVPQGDADALAHAILTLLRDPERARQMGARGREVVARHFRADEGVRRVESVYEEVLGQRGRVG